MTLAGSVFEMALYPNLFVAYIGRFAPNMVAGYRGYAIGFGMIAICAAWNVFGSRAVGDGSVFLNIALLLPFAVLAFVAVTHWHSAAGTGAAIPLHHADFLGGILIAMWNYMGWDNLSTIAGEVEKPQKTYTRAMLGAVVLVVLGYLIPVAAVGRIGLDPNSWTTGGWVDVGRIVGGQALALAIAIAGIFGAVGSFGALMMSFTRLPVVMAEDGYLPKVFTKRYSRSGAPWVAVIALAVFWAICFPLGFEHSLILDVLLTGLSILLEFWALAALRIREPGLPRPYRVPGGTIGTILIGLPPLALIVTALVRNSQESVGSTNELVIGAAIVAAGFLMYFLTRIFSRARRSADDGVAAAVSLRQEPPRRQA